jgi:hypothetical protein
MPMPAQPDRGPRFAADLALTLLSALAPFLSMLALTLLYALSDRHCERGSGLLWAVWGVALASSSAACWLLLRAHQAAAGSSEQEGPTQARVRFVIASGLMLNAVSLLLLASFASPLLALRPCQ